MFLEFYKLREQPFGDTPDPRFVYFSLPYREALASIFYGIDTGRGFLALIAKPGMGKTTLLFHLLETLRSSTRTAFLFQTQCDSRELLGQVLADLGVDGGDSNFVHMHLQLRELLLSEARAGRRVVVIVDEAQNLTESALETLRLLSDYENPQSKLIQIVLAGQPELESKLSCRELTQLCQRISILSRLGPLGREEVSVYIDHRLQIAGCNGGRLFTREAREIIASWSEGVPREINNLCYNALTLGYALRRKEIDGSHLQEVANDLEVSADPPGSDETGRVRKRAIMPASTKEPANVRNQAGACLSQGTSKLEAGRETPREAAEESLGEQRVAATSVLTFACRSESTPGQANAEEALREDRPLPFVSNFAGSRLAIRTITTFVASFVVSAAIALSMVGAARVFSSRPASAWPPETAAGGAFKVSSPVSRAAETLYRAQSSGATLGSRTGSRELPVGNQVRREETPHGNYSFLPPAIPRTAAKLSGDSPPELTAMGLGAPVETIDAVLPVRANVLLAPPPTPEPPARGHIGRRVKEAHLISKIEPNYPPAAKQISLEGNVVIDAMIDASGKLTDTKAVSGPALLRPAALDAVRKCKYEPSYLDDKPIPAEMFITVEFRLHR